MDQARVRARGGVFTIESRGMRGVSKPLGPLSGAFVRFDTRSGHAPGSPFRVAITASRTSGHPCTDGAGALMVTFAY
jgi:hypothetical protein